MVVENGLFTPDFPEPIGIQLEADVRVAKPRPEDSPETERLGVNGPYPTPLHHAGSSKQEAECCRLEVVHSSIFSE